MGRRLGELVATTAALVLCFSLPLYGLVRFAIQSTLYSHIVPVSYTHLTLPTKRIV